MTRPSRRLGIVFVAAAAAMIVVRTASISATGSVPAPLSANATVINNCKITTSDLTFTSYDPLAASDVTGTGTVTIACTKGASPTVALSVGANPTHATGTTRAFNNGTSYLSYEIYKDSNYATVWGDAGSAVLTAGAAPDKNGRSFTAYAKIPAGQDIVAGTYSDGMTATVNF